MAGLHLVGGDNVRAHPAYAVRDVAIAIQALAELIAEGAITAKKVMIVTVDEHGHPEVACFGEPFNCAEGLGLLDLAKAKIIDKIIAEVAR
jgi:hypothetical protein